MYGRSFGRPDPRPEDVVRWRFPLGENLYLGRNTRRLLPGEGLSSKQQAVTVVIYFFLSWYVAVELPDQSLTRIETPQSTETITHPQVSDRVIMAVYRFIAGFQR